MNNNKAIFAILSIMMIIVVVILFFSWSDFSSYRTHASLQLKYSEIISNRAAQQSPAVMGSIIAGASNILQFIPFAISAVALVGVSLVLYKALIIERKKPRVAFVKGRDAKRLAPDIYDRKKKMERETVRRLGHETRDLDGELAELARIAKVNALTGMTGPRQGFGEMPRPSGRFGGPRVTRFGGPIDSRSEIPLNMEDDDF